MRITRWGEYGILCCLYLAIHAKRSSESDSRVKSNNGAKAPKRDSDDALSATAIGAAEIADNQGIPTQYAQQILHRLRKGGVIKSIRGPKGGFLLARPAAEVTLRDILNAAEGHTFELICESDPVHQQACIHAEACGLRSIWEDLQSTVNTFLEQRTLASILDISPSLVRNLESALVPGPHRRVVNEAADKEGPSESGA